MSPGVNCIPIYLCNPLSPWTTIVQHIPLYQGQKGSAQESEHQTGRTSTLFGEKGVGTADKGPSMALCQAQNRGSSTDLQSQEAHNEVQGCSQVRRGIRSGIFAERIADHLPIGQSIPLPLPNGDVCLSRTKEKGVHPWKFEILLRNAIFSERRVKVLYLEETPRTHEAASSDHRWKEAYPFGGWSDVTGIQGSHYCACSSGECEQGGGECRKAWNW